MDPFSHIDNDILRQDINTLSAAPILNDFPDGSTFLVTGATGLLGSLAARSLSCSEKKFRVIAMARNKEKAYSVFGGLLQRGRLELFLGEISQPLEIPGEIDYIIHGASVTSSRFFVEKPVETIFTALDGTRNLLELARQKQVKKMVYLSSLEVYGAPDGSRHSLRETDFGYLDPMQVRSSYSEGKRMAECICAAYACQYGVPVTVARLSQTFGAGVSYDDGRVFGEFARCAMEGRDIILHTQGRTVRSYCYTTDALQAIFTLLAKGSPGEAYNITNEETAISIRDLAELVCSLVPEKSIGVRFDSPADPASYGYNPEMVIRLDSSKLRSLGWQPKVALPEMFRRLIDSLTGANQFGETP